jgi:hypothetical protein
VHVHASMHTHRIFPKYTYTQKKIISLTNDMSQKLRIKVHTPVEYTFGHVICYLLYLICHQLQGHFTELADLPNTTQKQTMHMQRHPPPLCVSFLCVCSKYIVSKCV